MPLYEYKCEKCGATVEVRQGFADPPMERCEVCSGRLKKMIAPPAIIFKGSGWYVTEHPSRERKEGIEKEKSPSGDGKKETVVKEKAAEKTNV